MSVDCLDFEIQEPHPFQLPWSKRWYSHKFKGPGLRYEVALSIIAGDIVWTNGPFPCGMKDDWQIFRDGLRNFLENDERVEADDGYGAGDPEFVKTPAGINHPIAKKAFRNCVRARQESVNQRFRQWGALGLGHQVYRHDIMNHQTVFQAVVVITQVAIENGEPLFDVSNYDDE